MRPLLLALCVLALSACAEAPTPPPMLSPRQLADIPQSVYRLQPGDVLDISFRLTPELDSTQTVRLDGRISLSYLGDISVADMDVDLLQKTLQTDYAPILNKPVITIALRSSAASRVFVGGEVATPGEFPFSGRGTLAQYLTKAGGLKRSAAGERVLLIRRGPDLRPYTGVLNADAVFSGDPAQDIALRPYDVVYVPPSNIARVDRFVDQYIRQIVPVSFGFDYLFP